MYLELIVFAAFCGFLWYYCSTSVTSSRQYRSPDHLNRIADQYSSLEEVQSALKKSGLESSNLIIGVDFTASNASQGRQSYYGKSLHDLDDTHINPYRQVISIMAETLAPFDEDNIIPAYGFGDLISKHHSVFPLSPHGDCYGIEQALSAYVNVAKHVRMSGPTCFAPLIRKAIDIVKRTRDYHILVIIADGQVTNQGPTIQAIVEASNYPLSIVMVGVGDGPWEMMEEFDDGLPARRFDNFQFVDFHQIMTHRSTAGNASATFAYRALQEIPAQYKTLVRMGLIG